MDVTTDGKLLLAANNAEDPPFATRFRANGDSAIVPPNDLYSFDPNVQVRLEEFTDIVGRNFTQPTEGLGFDTSPSAHMWRTFMWPMKYL